MQTNLGEPCPSVGDDHSTADAASAATREQARATPVKKPDCIRLAPIAATPRKNASPDNAVSYHAYASSSTDSQKSWTRLWPMLRDARRRAPQHEVVCSTRQTSS